MNLAAVDPTRYETSVRTRLQQFLENYLQADHAALFSKVGGVDVFLEYPNLPSNAKGLPRSRVIVGTGRDEMKRTFANSAQRQHEGEYHTLALEVQCITDEEKGSATTCNDLAGAVQLCFMKHSGDLDAIGVSMNSRASDPISFDKENNLYLRVVNVIAEVQVVGEAIRTLQLSLGQFVVTATGSGSFSPGVTLDLAHQLQIRLLTGTSTKPSFVTVFAVNADGVTKQVDGIVPATRSANTLINLAGADPQEEYTQVLSIAISEVSGLPGEAFDVVNIPQQVTGG